MNPTVARLTARTLLGRRRTVLLLLLPLALIGLCVLARVLAGMDPDIEHDLEGALAANLLGAFGLSILLPLLGLIAGTGAIGPEIDDGSIVYLLSKPLNRLSIVVTKLAVAIGVVIAFGVVPVLISGLILTGGLGGVVLAYAAASLVAGVAYCAVFLLLAVLTRNAVVIGLIYALIWETLLGLIIGGAQALSIQQWATAIAEQVYGAGADEIGIDPAVGVTTATLLLAAVTIGSTWYAGRRLRSLRLSDDG